ncbi:hypothetical protein HYDPIDRAFT_170914 [Hydnomerulius pinastri MD-312]|uniref:Uncharacterized protein n=1 Tax=Hydnomerulius pinastri MD-312 TaxID=994086 RepID=A0A0C9VNM7_9AGAM|nr:hypothetical protein HYDPIDRAFT_170914 [Hydnomerulius pinastri MD-312]
MPTKLVRCFFSLKISFLSATTYAHPVCIIATDYQPDGGTQERVYCKHKSNINLQAFVQKWRSSNTVRDLDSDEEDLASTLLPGSHESENSGDEVKAAGLETREDGDVEEQDVEAPHLNNNILVADVEEKKKQGKKARWSPSVVLAAVSTPTNGAPTNSKIKEDHSYCCLEEATQASPYLMEKLQAVKQDPATLSEMLEYVWYGISQLHVYGIHGTPDAIKAKVKWLLDHNSFLYGELDVQVGIFLDSVN